MHIHAFAASDRGRQRELNEDRFLIDESLGLHIVCDGMGGHAAGEIAAERSVAFAAEYVRDHRNILEKAKELPDGYPRVLQLAEGATQEASRRLYQLACSDARFAGMGTTMTMLLVVDDKAVMAHVGDSRLYLLRGGELHQLSCDHTLANELLQAGELTQASAKRSEYNHVLTRTIGHQPMVQAESLLFDLFPGDTCLLCSDGLSNYFDDPSTVTEPLQSADVSDVPRQFVEFANLRGGADNITSIVLRIATSHEDVDTRAIQHRLEILKSIFLCHAFSANRLMRVLNITSILECAGGQRLFSPGQTIDGLYVVLDGRLTIEDDAVLSRELLPGDFVGESALVGDGRIDASVIADETSTLLFIGREPFGRLVRGQPRLGNALLTNLGRQLSESLDQQRCCDRIGPDDTPDWRRNPT